MEEFRALDTDEPVDFTAQFLARAGSRDRDGDDDTAGQGTHGLDRGFHGRPGGQAIVNENDDAAFDDCRGPAVPVCGLATLDLGAFTSDDGVDGRLRNAIAANDIVVDNDLATAGDRPHGQFLLTRNAELTHNEDVEREMQLAGNFEGNRNAAARQSEHNDLAGGEFFTAFVADDLPENAASVSPIVENDDHSNPWLP